MISIKLHIDGMSCNGCAQSIERRLQSTSGVHSVSVDLQNRTADISFDEQAVSEEKLGMIINDLGFQVVRS